MKIDDVVLDTSGVSGLSEEEGRALKSEIEILSEKEIPRGSVPIDTKRIVREIRAIRHKTGFYYRIEDNALDANGEYLNTVGREGYSSEELR